MAGHWTDLLLKPLVGEKKTQDLVRNPTTGKLTRDYRVVPIHRPISRCGCDEFKPKLTPRVYENSDQMPLEVVAICERCGRNAPIQDEAVLLISGLNGWRHHNSDEFAFMFTDE